MTIDLEIQAMSTVAEALSGLDERARERVLRWAAARFATNSVISSHEESESETIDISEFTHFGELFNAANPSTEKEKVLVASYWFQEVEGDDDVTALSINKELKQLGYGIGNITREFTGLQDEKPSLILQIQKKGPTKQARKRYKVTAAGIHKVKSMVRGD